MCKQILDLKISWNFWALCIDVLLYEESKTLKMDKAQEVDGATLPTTVQIRKVNYS